VRLVWVIAALAALAPVACGGTDPAPREAGEGGAREGGAREGGAREGSAQDPRAHFAAEAAPVERRLNGDALGQRAPRPRGRHLTARIVRPVALRDAPGGRRLARLTRRTEFGSPHVLAVTRRRDGWLQVLTPELPNGERGWIRARAARLGATDHAIVIDRSARRARLTLRGRTLRSFPVAVGRPGNETPLGRFAVTDLVRPKDPTSPYGCCALALSGRQTRLQPGWPGGDRLAIHGTPQPETIGQAVSLGCLRAPRRDLEALMRRVPLGTPVRIRR
jgi:hypothetical protein